MSSSYYSLVPRNQKPYATPWYQRTFVDIPVSLEEELENAITQLISENDISRVPSADAIYKYLYQRLRNTILADSSNVFTANNTFSLPITSETSVDFDLEANNTLLPNVSSIKEYVTNLITGEIPDLNEYVTNLINAAINNSFTYISSSALQNHIILHNMNSAYIIYNVLILDTNTGTYKNDIFTALEIDSNTLVIELESPQIIKVIVTRIITGHENSFTYTSSEVSTAHLLTHNLHSPYVYYNIMVYNEDIQLYRNDIVSITEINHDSMLIEATEPINIKAAIAVF